MTPKHFESTKIEAFIKDLGEDELIYLNRPIVERLKLISQEKSTKPMGRFNPDFRRTALERSAGLQPRANGTTTSPEKAVRAAAAPYSAI